MPPSSRSPGPSARAVLRWTIVAIVLLGLVASYAMTLRVSPHLVNPYLAVPLAFVGFFSGMLVTLIGVILGVARTIRNHQWGWLVTIVSGTLLILAATLVIDGAFYSLNLCTSQDPGGCLAQRQAWDLVVLPIGLALTPLTVGLYGVVSGRRRVAETGVRAIS